MSDAVAHAGARHAAHVTPHHPALQHQFDTMGQQKEAAVLGMWAFLLTEILFFGGLFMAYMLYRTWYHDAFRAASTSITLFWGALNTVVLIGSSLTMALAVRAAQTNKRQATVNWLIADDASSASCSSASRSSSTPTSSSTITCRARISSGRSRGTRPPAHGDPSPSRRTRRHFQQHTQIFFSLYFTMTGLHALHMIIGIGLMLVITWMAWKGKFDEH